jgi:hypothetical protein
MLASNDENVQAVGAVIAAIGLVALVIGAGADAMGEAVKADADARYWDNMPGTIFLVSAKLDPGKYNLIIDKNQSIEVVIKDDKHVFTKYIDITKSNANLSVANLDIENARNKFLSTKLEQTSTDSTQKNPIQETRSDD